MKLLLSFPLFLMLLSCDIIPSAVDGSQKIRINAWRDLTPNLYVQNDVPYINVSEEKNVLDFDMRVEGKTIYLAYTTAKKFNVIKKPSDTTLGTFDIALPEAGKTISEISEEIDGDQKEVSYVTFDTVAGTSETVSKITTHAQHNGVWVRFLKGQVTGTPTDLRINWELVFETKDADFMSISNIKILPLKERKETLVAISNERSVIVFNDADKNGILNYLPHSLNNIPASRMKSLNTWVDDDDTYVSVFADSRLMTGFYRNLNWTETFNAKMSDRIEQMQVKMGKEVPYAVWVDTKQNSVNFLIYNKRDVHKYRWMETDRINNANLPQLSSSLYRNNRGVIEEHIQLGAVDRRIDYFQLHESSDFKLAHQGPIITGWNQRYALVANNLGQVLFVRSEVNGKPIFSGLNSLNRWEVIQANSQPDPKIGIQSPIQAFFVEGVYPLTIFIDDKDALYLLGGAFTG